MKIVYFGVTKTKKNTPISQEINLVYLKYVLKVVLLNQIFIHVRHDIFIRFNHWQIDLF